MSEILSEWVSGRALLPLPKPLQYCCRGRLQEMGETAQPLLPKPERVAEARKEGLASRAACLRGPGGRGWVREGGGPGLDRLRSKMVPHVLGPL